MLNFQLSHEQLKLQQKARSFAMDELLSVAWYYDERDEFPVEVIKKAFDEGMLEIDIPEEYGGKGLSLVDSAVITEEIAAACPGLATSIFDSSLGVELILLSTNEAAKKKYLPQ